MSASPFGVISHSRAPGAHDAPRLLEMPQRIADVLEQVLLDHEVEAIGREARRLQRPVMDRQTEPLAGVAGAERRQLDALDLPVGGPGQRVEEEAQTASHLQQPAAASRAPQPAGQEVRLALVALPLPGVLAEAGPHGGVEVVLAVQRGQVGGAGTGTDLAESAAFATVDPHRAEADQADLDPGGHPVRHPADVARLLHVGSCGRIRPALWQPHPGAPPPRPW